MHRILIVRHLSKSENLAYFIIYFKFDHEFGIHQI